jgi:hypothetical protein
LRPVGWEGGELVLSFEHRLLAGDLRFKWLCEQHAKDLAVATGDLSMEGCSLCNFSEPREFEIEGGVEEEEVILIEVGNMRRGDKCRVPIFVPVHAGLVCYDCLSTVWKFPVDWEEL